MIPTRTTVIQDGDLLNLFILQADADDVHRALDAGPGED